MLDRWATTRTELQVGINAAGFVANRFTPRRRRKITPAAV